MSTPMSTVEIRLAIKGDVSSILAIYNESIPKRIATADLVPQTFDVRMAWFKSHDFATRPIVVAVRDEKVVGWGSFTNFKERSAYAPTAEVSVYVSDAAAHQGVGRAILDDLLERADTCGIDRILAICFSHNEPSLKLFRSSSGDCFRTRVHSTGFVEVSRSSVSAAEADRFHFNRNRRGQAIDFDRGARGIRIPFAREIFCVDAVVDREVVLHVGEEHRDIRNARPRQTSISNDCAKVVEARATLQLNVFGDDSAARIERDTRNRLHASLTRTDARKKNEVSHALCVGICANGFGSAMGNDVCHGVLLWSDRRMARTGLASNPTSGSGSAMSSYSPLCT